MKSLVSLVLTVLLSLTPIRAEDAPPALGFLMKALDQTDDADTQVNLLRGINKALEGRRALTAPEGWDALAAKLAKSANAEVREQMQTLGAIFGSSAALEAMRKLVAQPDGERAAREKALDSLLAAKDKDTLPLLLELAKSPGPIRRAAVRGLTAYDDPRIGETLVATYATLDTEEKREAIGSLLARPSSARTLTAAFDAKTIPFTDLSTPQLRQLKSLKDAPIEDWLRSHPAMTLAVSDKLAEATRLRAFLTPETVKAGDASRGRALFTQTCALCHRLFDAGADIGPELTGANRTDTDYLLQNILDPNALIGKDYQSTTVETNDGRFFVGIVRSDDANALTLKTLGGPVVIPRGDIKTVTVSEVSLMPEGLLSALAPDQVRDLFAYLGSPRQVPILATALNAGDFFNARDFTRWRKSGDAWTVADGAFTGRGGAQHPEALVSEMIAGDFKLTAQIKITGDQAAAEIVLRGRAGDEPFSGVSLSFGGATASNLWLYNAAGKPQPALNGPVVESGKWIACEIVAAGPKMTVKLGGRPAFDFSAPGAETRTIPAFHIFGEGAELALKDIRLEAAP